MNSRLSGSEEALATLVCARMRSRERARLLVGGLGMGFTLRAALAQLGPLAQVAVAELVPEIVLWARGFMADVFGNSLEDPRVNIIQADVAQVINAPGPPWDAILLDVDNGPQGLTRPQNDALYGLAGLGAARAALRPGGVLAVWSQGPDDRFAARLKSAGFKVEEERVRASRSRRGARHVVWLATRR